MSKHIHTLKNDLFTIHEEWEKIAADEALLSDLDFLMQFAQDITALDDDALALMQSGDKEKGRLVHHLLATPWGAPFASDETLLEAAKAFQKKPALSAPFHQIIANFHRFGSEFKTQVFDIFDDIMD